MGSLCQLYYKDMVNMIVIVVLDIVVILIKSLNFSLTLVKYRKELVQPPC